MLKRLSLTLTLITFISISSTAQLRHSVSVTGGFAYTGDGDMWGTAVEGAYTYYWSNWSVSGQIGRADFSGARTTVIGEPDLGFVNFVPADVVTTYRTADVLLGYTFPFANNRMNFIGRVGPSLGRIATYYVNPIYANNDFDVLDVGAVAEVGFGYTVIRSGTATIDLNIKASGRTYLGTHDGYGRISVGITCRLYDQ